MFERNEYTGQWRWTWNDEAWKPQERDFANNDGARGGGRDGGGHDGGGRGGGRGGGHDGGGGGHGGGGGGGHGGGNIAWIIFVCKFSPYTFLVLDSFFFSGDP